MTENSTAVENTPAEEIKAVALSNTSDLAELLAASESSVLDVAKPAISLNATTFELRNPGESIRGLYFGIGVMTVKDKDGKLSDIPALQLLKDRKIHLNGGVNLVGTVKGANLKQGTPIEITLAKLDGNVKIYDVSLLG